MAQRGIALALRRGARLKRLAVLLLSIGQHRAAGRLSRIALELREVAA